MTTTQDESLLHARVAVIGAGSMGAGIAQLAILAGHEVKLFDQHAGAAQKAVQRMAADLRRSVERGHLSEPEFRAALTRLSISDSIEELNGCSLAVEAIVERLDVKQALLLKLQNVLGPQAILASNTSSLSITALAQTLPSPERIVGWHFFNPATRMKLVEIVPGMATSPDVVAAMHRLSAAWGKTSIDAPNIPGFIVNRVARPYYTEGMRLLAERIAGIAAIDHLMREAGEFPMGPFELTDLIGQDVNLAVTESVFQGMAYDSRYAPPLMQQELVRAGRLGRKSGLGFYDHRDVAAGKPAVAMIEPEMHGLPLTIPRQVGLLRPLIRRLQREGVPMQVNANLPEDILAIGDVRIGLTDGRTAGQRGAKSGTAWILLDLARDFGRTSVLGASANRAGSPHLARLAGLLGGAGIAVMPLSDVAGLVLMRIVCCLANEAATLLSWHEVTPNDIDTAMRLGTSYPMGPLGWADTIGPSRVAKVLHNLHNHYGDTRYRSAPALTCLYHGEGKGFHHG